MNPCSVHRFLSISAIFFILFAVWCSFCWLPTCRILPECWSSFFPLFCFVPRGVSAVADPFLKIRVTKAALILTWQSHKLFCLGVLCLLVQRWREKGEPEKGELLSLWVSLTTDFVYKRVIFEGENCIGDLLPHPSSKFSAAQRGEYVRTDRSYSLDILLMNV